MDEEEAVMRRAYDNGEDKEEAGKDKEEADDRGDEEEMRQARTRRRRTIAAMRRLRLWVDIVAPAVIN